MGVKKLKKEIKKLVIGGKTFKSRLIIGTGKYTNFQINKKDAIIINAGGYTHTSIAILDSLRAFTGLIYEVHISNIYNREYYRRKSYISLISNGVICGLGILGYEIAIDAISLKQ